MCNLDREGILELFDCYKKNIICLNIDQTYIIGLIKRGARIWFRQCDRNIVDRLEMNFNFRKSIGYINDNCTDEFDYCLMDINQYNLYEPNMTPLVRKLIVIVTGGLNIFKWMMKSKNIESINKYNLYSIVPSFDDVKMIIPEQCTINVQRYWSIKDSNILVSIQLISQWIFIKNNFLRRYFSDKLVIIKC